MGSIYANGNGTIKGAVDIARDWIGYEEGDNNWNIFAKVLDECYYFTPQKKQNVPYCSIFIDFCLLQASIPEDRPNKEKKYDAQNYQYQPARNNYSAGAYEHAGYFKGAGKFFTDQHQAQTGDIIYFNVNGKIGHVGIVECVEGSIITTIEANSGDMVQRKWYDIGDKRIAGFGRPFYDGLYAPSENKNEEPVMEAVINDIPNEDKPAEEPEKVVEKKNVDELAKEVIDGKWGNGKDRANRLTEAGYNYQEVQDRVNELLNVSSKPNSANTSKKIVDYVVIAPHGLNIRNVKPADTSKPFGEGSILVAMNYGETFHCDTVDGLWNSGYFERNGKKYRGWACGNSGIWLKKKG